MSDFNVKEYQAKLRNKLSGIYSAQSELDMCRSVDNGYIVPSDTFAKVYSILGDYAKSTSFKLHKTEVNNERLDKDSSESTPF